MFALPDFVAGLPLGEYLTQLSIFVGGSCLVNFWLTTATKGTLMSKDFDGAPLWNVLMAIIYQGVVFPVLIYFSISQYDSLHAHMNSTWAECPDNCWIRWYYFVILGYLIKDLVFDFCKPLTVTHHIAGVIYHGGFMFISAGAHAFLAATSCCEIANVFLNIHVVSMGVGSIAAQRFCLQLALLVFTVTHALALYTIYYLCAHALQRADSDASRLWTVLVVIASAIVVSLRQHQLMLKWPEHLKREREEAAEKKA